MTTAQARFWMRVRFQKRRAGWRGWVGDWLRRAAYRLDRLPTMTIDIDTVPPLSGRQKADIYRAAEAAIVRDVTSELEAELIDHAMREFCPALYVGAPDQPRGDRRI